MDIDVCTQKIKGLVFVNPPPPSFFWVYFIISMNICFSLKKDNNKIKNTQEIQCSAGKQVELSSELQ